VIVCPHCQRPVSLGDVLVVHESAETFAVVSRILSATGHAPVNVQTGVQAAALTQSTSFSLVLIDVAIQGIYAFELVPKLKALAASPYVVLLASVYDKTAYKRAPTSLYGADAYLEQHHLPDELPNIVAKVFSSGLTAIPYDTVKAQRAVLRDAAHEDPVAGSSEEQLQQARHLARRVLLDVSLYQGDLWAQGIAGKNLRELLQKPLSDAKVFMAERLPLALKGGGAPDFIEEALRELLAEQGGVK
jgi:CheY-like chemotaxis protein